MKRLPLYMVLLFLFTACVQASDQGIQHRLETLEAQTPVVIVVTATPAATAAPTLTMTPTATVTASPTKTTTPLPTNTLRPIPPTPTQEVWTPEPQYTLINGAVVARAGLNVRSCPTTSCPVVKVLRFMETMTVREESCGPIPTGDQIEWCQLNDSGNWVAVKIGDDVNVVFR